MAKAGIPRGRLLYFPGDWTSAKRPGVVEATRSLLEDLGIDVQLSERRTSGHPALDGGYVDDFKRAAAEIEKERRMHRCVAVLSNEPEAVLALRHASIPSFHLLELLNENLERLPGAEGVATYLHPQSMLLLGIEMKIGLRVLRRAGIHIPAEQRVAGGCAGPAFTTNNPELASKLASFHQQRISSGLVISPCPHCQITFKGVKDIVEVLSEQ